MDKNVQTFVEFIVDALSECWNKPEAEVYKILNDTDILNSYIIGCYDVLHTQGKEYLVEDITEFVQEKGVDLG